MKLIEIPAPVNVNLRRKENDEPVPVKFPEWATNVIDFYSDGVKTLKQVRQVQKIVEALEKATEAVTLEDADYDLLKAAVEAYPTKMPPVIVRQHLAFVDAIEKAQEVKK